jgi:hypothetical protein
LRPAWRGAQPWTRSRVRRVKAWQSFAALLGAAPNEPPTSLGAVRTLVFGSSSTPIGSSPGTWD